jgi:hypothetical protein
LHPAVTQRVQGGGKVAGGGEAVGVVGAEVLAVAVENVPVLACPMPRISETEPTGPARWSGSGYRVRSDSPQLPNRAAQASRILAVARDRG